jgi:hypothetical protein
MHVICQHKTLKQNKNKDESIIKEVQLGIFFLIYIIIHMAKLLKKFGAFYLGFNFWYLDLAI